MKPKVSVIIPTLGRETLYPLIDNLLKQKATFSYEIVLIPQAKLDESKLKDKKIKIFYEPPGRGFAYYRNVGIKRSKGDIIAFIDDDEMPMNSEWLSIITEPIRKGKEKVTTSGYKIKLGQGYFTDSVSLLGFPGGGAIGFEVMWPLKEVGYTYHICTGNLAIDKKNLIRVGSFTESLIYGNEDVDLGDKLINKKIKIKYLKEATVYHVSRKGYFNFVRWSLLRGKSAGFFLKYSRHRKGKLSNRFASSGRILNEIIRDRPIHLPGVIFMMLNQYLWQGIGAMLK